MFKFCSALASSVLGFHLLLTAVEAEGEDCPRFEAAKTLGIVEDRSLTEASGLVVSRKNPGVLWTHNDSGNAPWLYALAEDGSTRGIYLPTPSANVDWEDIAIGPGPTPGQDYLYIGDIGDNRRKRPSIIVYRVPEPPIPTTLGPEPFSLPGTVALRLEYPDGERHNAETLLVDPDNADLYILTKNKSTGVSGLYRAPFPQNESEVSQLERVATIAFSGGRSERPATGGDISADGKTILVRTYTRGYLWTRSAGATIASTLKTPACSAPLAIERQGESVALTTDGQNYFTLSEGSLQPIYFYERVGTVPLLRPAGP